MRKNMSLSFNLRLTLWNTNMSNIANTIIITNTQIWLQYIYVYSHLWKTNALIVRKFFNSSQREPTRPIWLKFRRENPTLFNTKLFIEIDPTLLKLYHFKYDKLFFWQKRSKIRVDRNLLEISYFNCKIESP